MRRPVSAAGLAAAGAGALVDGVAAAPTPPVQVQLFESASYTCYPTFSVIPYGFGPTVSVMTPTFGTGTWNAYNQYGTSPTPALGAAPLQSTPAAPAAPAPQTLPAPDAYMYEPQILAETETETDEDGPEMVFEEAQEVRGFTPAPEFSANSCGCCRTPFSVMPPNAFQAWRPLLEQVNAPYSALLGCKNNYGGGCGGRQSGYGYGF